MTSTLGYILAAAKLIPDLVGDVESVKSKLATDKTTQQKVTDVLTALTTVIEDVIKNLL